MCDEIPVFDEQIDGLLLDVVVDYAIAEYNAAVIDYSDDDYEEDDDD
jgi:hypothetical protein